MAQPRPIFDVRCKCCDRRYTAQRVRGRWRGVVRVFDSHLDNDLVQLAAGPLPDTYSRTFCCRDCRQEANGRK